VTWTQCRKLALVIAVGVVLQTTVFSAALRVFGVTPDLALLLTVAVAYYSSPERGAVFGFVAGLVTDLFINTPFGVSALSFTLVGYGVGVVQSRLIRAPRWIAPVMGILGGLAGGALFTGIAALAGREELIALRSMRVVLIASMYDAVLAFVAFPIARWAARGASSDVRAPLRREWAAR
jgi:rod shape-determining protein MreD